jgi:hypothetical protein
MKKDTRGRRIEDRVKKVKTRNQYGTMSEWR